VFKEEVTTWLTKEWVCEWTGKMEGDGDFFGLPNSPPFYVGAQGMNSLPQALRENAIESGIVILHKGSRIDSLHRDATTKKWTLMGKTGDAALHTTPEDIARMTVSGSLTDRQYDIVVLTDISSRYTLYTRYTTIHHYTLYTHYTHDTHDTHYTHYTHDTHDTPLYTLYTLYT
jgi:hypothetical protein